MSFGVRLRAFGSGQGIPYHPQGPAYHCSLPGLAEGMGFEPTAPFWGAHALQVCLLDRSSTPPTWYTREDSNLRPAA